MLLRTFVPFIGVTIIIKDPTIRVTTLQCWATPEQDPHGELQHYLIQDGCGVDGVLDGTLAILENGQSKMAKWQGAVFQFVGYDEVWLHCDIKVCFNDADCLPSCGSLGTRGRITSSWVYRQIDIERDGSALVIDNVPCL